MKKKIEIFMAVTLLVAACLFAAKGDLIVGSENVEKKKAKIVLDSGHGGIDPGKVGINGAKEKDINLQITLKLKKLLEVENIEVIMTRTSDKGLYQEGTQNKKAEDMRTRCEIITKNKPDFTISIHQNSFPEEYVKGAQVFYYKTSAESEQLANILQTALVSGLNTENKRQAKADSNYYLLKKTPTPTVIVECGFLSNCEEANLLITEEYQNKVAQAICTGILTYLEQ